MELSMYYYGTIWWWQHIIMVAYYDDTICLCNMLMVASCGVYLSFTQPPQQSKVQETHFAFDFFLNLGSIQPLVFKLFVTQNESELPQWPGDGPWRSRPCRRPRQPPWPRSGRRSPRRNVSPARTFSQAPVRDSRLDIDWTNICDHTRENIYNDLFSSFLFLQQQ